MTETTTTTPVPSTTPGTEQAEAVDSRELLSRAAHLAVEVAAAISPDQFDLPTPCEDWNVRQLLAHTLGAAERVRHAGAGEPLPEIDVDRTDIADDAWAAAFAESAVGMATAWADPDRLGQPIELPFATMPGAAVVAIYTAELTTHCWDLARATGQDVAWDQEVAAAALAAMKPILPAEPREAPLPFGPVGLVADDGPAIDQLVAWQGRQP